jgi:hypothetical protein
MTLLDVRVPMPARGGHEIDISFQVVIGVVAPPIIQGIDEQSKQAEVEGALTSFEELMVVNPEASPVLCLLMEIASLFIGGCVG